MDNLSMCSVMSKVRSEFIFHDLNNRLSTFKNWPYQDNCACTPEKLASAGFVYCGTDGEPDLVKCFVCLKELDGWEPEDDPWQEHVSHSGNCPWIKHNKVEKITVKEFLELEQARAVNHADKLIRASNADFNDQVKSVKEKLKAFKNKMNVK